MDNAEKIIDSTIKEISKQRGFIKLSECISDNQASIFIVGLIDEISALAENTLDYENDHLKKKLMITVKNSADINADAIKVDASVKDDIYKAALACKKAGVMPYWLTKAIAFSFLNLGEKIEKDDLKKRIIEECDFLNMEPEIVQLIVDRYFEAHENPDRALSEEKDYIDLFKKAWYKGFSHEKNYRGCAQCTLLAARDSFGLFNSKVFESASALSAGMALCGDGVCGGYSGGLMNIGLTASRSIDDLETKNKENQAKGMAYGQKLHDKFVECYGSVICSDIHNSIFGKSFLIRDSKNKEPFEEAGAHSDKCTSVVAMSLYWLTQIFGHEYWKENA
jgi:C_GCAxxG_C_C family probable redox protein